MSCVGRVRSAFLDAECALAASELSGAPAAGSGSSGAWSKPSLLKLPSQSRSHVEPHWADTTGSTLYLSPSCTPSIESFRSLQTGFCQPLRSPQVTSVRTEQEDSFRSPSTSSAVMTSRKKEEGSFKAPPNTPLVETVRSVESSFRGAATSPQLQLLRQSEDPFKRGAHAGGHPSQLQLSASSPHGHGPSPRSGAGAVRDDIVLSVRQQIETFRSEPHTPKLIAIRDKLEAFVADQAAQDPVKAALAMQVDDPFGSGPSFNSMVHAT